MTMPASEQPAIIRAYEDADHAQAVDLFVRINRELAPPGMRERFEQYIQAQTSIDGELSRLRDVFSETRRNAFWVVESGDEIIVASVAEHGPAAAAGMRRGDVLAGVGGSEIESLGDFYRKIWSRGPAGVEIPIEIVRDGRAIGLRVRSADRSSFLKRPRLQ